jgi:hypothetical protein
MPMSAPRAARPLAPMLSLPRSSAVPTAGSVVDEAVHLVVPVLRQELIPPLPSPATAAAVTTAQAGARHATPAHPHAAPARPPESSGGGGGERAPRTPFGPPGHSVSGSSSAAPPAATAAGLFFAILLGLAAYGFQELRRHRAPFIVLAPTGFSSPRQRPG